MTRFARTGYVLHLTGDAGVLCATEDAAPTATVTRDDVLCGMCLDNLPATSDAGVPFADDSSVERLRAMSYSSYLRTHHWFVIRRAAIDHYGHACLLCGDASNVEVHHRTYDRRGQERLHDLTVLCRACHARHHSEAA